MKKSPKLLPSLATKLLKGFTSYDEDFNIITTIQDIYKHKLETDGKHKANIWYWRQVLCSIPRSVYSIFIWKVAMLLNHLKIAFRNIQRSKGFSFINIAGLSVGMACFILIMLYIKYELSYHLRNTCLEWFIMSQ